MLESRWHTFLLRGSWQVLHHMRATDSLSCPWETHTFLVVSSTISANSLEQEFIWLRGLQVRMRSISISGLVIGKRIHGVPGCTILSPMVLSVIGQILHCSPTVREYIGRVLCIQLVDKGSRNEPFPGHAMANRALGGNQALTRLQFC